MSVGGPVTGEERGTVRRISKADQKGISKNGPVREANKGDQEVGPRWETDKWNQQWQSVRGTSKDLVFQGYRKGKLKAFLASTMTSVSHPIWFILRQACYSPSSRPRRDVRLD